MMDLIRGSAFCISILGSFEKRVTGCFGLYYAVLFEIFGELIGKPHSLLFFLMETKKK